MKILASVLLAGFVMFGQQAIAKESPPAEKIGDWKFATNPDDITNTIGYSISTISDANNSFLSITCFNNNNDRLAGFATGQSLRDTQSDTKDFIITKVDNKDEITYLWRIKSMNGLDVLMSAEVDNFLKDLKNGNRLFFGVLSERGTHLKTAHFSLIGFDKSYQKLQSLCHFKE